MIPQPSLVGGTTKQSAPETYYSNGDCFVAQTHKINPLLLAMTILFSIILFTSCSPKIKYDKVRKPPKHGLITPPGTVWLKDSLFMDKTEIRNIDYREYYWWNSLWNYDGNLPDTAIWCKPTFIDKYYFRHPYYDNFPIVGVTYAQASAFCKWRSYVVNLNYYIHSSKIGKRKYYNLMQNDTVLNIGKIDSFFKVPEYIRYRLPTKKEWEYAAHAGLDSNYYPFGYESILKDNTPVSKTLEFSLQYHVPFYISPNDTLTRSYALGYIGRRFLPSDSRFGKPNQFGIYNILANVSELVQDSLVKGLNYRTLMTGNILLNEAFHPYNLNTQLFQEYNEYNLYSREFKYTKPTNYIGFRCICEVLKNP